MIGRWTRLVSCDRPKCNRSVEYDIVLEETDLGAVKIAFESRIGSISEWSHTCLNDEVLFFCPDCL